MPLPEDRQYTAEHEWIQIEGDRARVGVTQYAADALGDIVYLDLPSAGSVVAAGEPCGEIESTKSVSDLFSPANGTVIEVNEDLLNEPGRVNSDPYSGWLFVLNLDSAGPLLSAAEYQALTEPTP
ncbi:MAG TPA: glycine cleavage system protein GcvH [Rhodoglobus sp.]|nr:glycine cleavage system protein GcvH [Rhodoglobus sp.]